LEKLLIPGLGRENTRQSSSINRLMYKQKCAIVNTTLPSKRKGILMHITHTKKSLKHDAK
jgi:hypothetical protein